MTDQPHAPSTVTERLTPAYTPELTPATTPSPASGIAGNADAQEHTGRPTTPAPAPPLSSRHLPALDGARGIAILMVMLLHFSTGHEPTNGFGYVLWRAFQWGWTGVDLFFVLSGFLITGILHDAKGGAHYFRTFYARRTLRIFPLYYGALAIYFLFAWRVAGPAYVVPLEQQAWYWTYLGNFHTLPWESKTMIGHFWSLAIEEQFYLVWPLVIFTCTRRRALAVCGVGVVAAFLFRLIALLNGASGALVYHFTFGRVDGLALGAVIALVLRAPAGAAQLRHWAPRVAFVAAAVIIGMRIAGHGRGPAVNYFWLMSVGYTAIALLFASAVAGIVTARDRAPVTRLLSNRVLVRLGTLSYGLYVLHPALLRVVAWAGLAPSAQSLARYPLLTTLAFPAAMSLLSLAAAYASWHLYEKHFLKLKRHFEYSRGGVRERQAA